MANSEITESPLKLLLIALGVGILAILLTIWYLNAKEAQLRKELTPQVTMRDVIVATQPLLKGTKLDSTVLSVRSVPENYLHREALQPGDFEAIDGKVLIQNVDSGNVILASYVALGFPRDFSDTIPLKRRAMTIQVDELNTINGFIRPGNRIDLFSSIRAGTLKKAESLAQEDGSTFIEKPAEPKTDMIVPILENVEVLATGSSASRDYEEKVRQLRGGFQTQIDTSYTTLTLNVTPREAAILSTAIEKGSLMALLRNRKDKSGSGFASLKPEDLLTHSAKLARESSIRDLDAAAQGFKVGADGVIRTKDGVALKNQNLIVAADGTIMTKDGIILSGRGLTVNENGELVDKDGNVVDPDTLRVGADGSIITADGRVLDGRGGKVIDTKGLKVVRSADGTATLEMADGTVVTGLTINENGKVVLADGTEVDPSDLIFTSDGRIMTKDGKLVSGSIGKSLKDPKIIKNADGTVTLETADGTVISGLKLNANGKVVLADGTEVDPSDLVIGADGKVRTKDGRLVEGAKAGQNVGQLTVNENGDVVLADGRVLKGATLNSDGKLVLADGTVVDPNDVVIRADGTVVTKSGNILAGLSADALGSNTAYEVDYIVGGNSSHGVAEVKKVPVADTEKSEEE